MGEQRKSGIKEKREIKGMGCDIREERKLREDNEEARKGEMREGVMKEKILGERNGENGMRVKNLRNKGDENKRSGECKRCGTEI